MEMAFQTIAKNALEQETEVFIELTNIKCGMLMTLHIFSRLNSSTIFPIKYA